MAITPNSGARFFTQGYGNQHAAPAFQYLFDSGIVWNETNGTLRTGAMRPVTPSDFANVTISGLSFTGQLAIDDQIGITGVVNVTGVTNTGSYSFVSSGITGSQGFIPVGAMSWSAYVESGNASINGITYNTFESIMGGGYDGQKKLGSPIVVGCTGSAAAPCRLILNWEV